MIFRNSEYWVLLILMTMGTRLTDVLQLKRSDIIVRDVTLYLNLCWTAEQDGKTLSQPAHRADPTDPAGAGLRRVSQAKPLGHERVIDICDRRQTLHSAAHLRRAGPTIHARHSRCVALRCVAVWRDAPPS